MATDLERFIACMEYESCDRRPNHELGAWPQTRVRWEKENPAAVENFGWRWFYEEPALGLDRRDYIPINFGFIPPFGEEVLESDVSVMVEFWASWCPPCKMSEPLIAELASEYDGQLKIGKLNVDQNPKAASTYRIQGVPTFALFRHGEMVQRRVGSQSKDQLLGMVREELQ